MLKNNTINLEVIRKIAGALGAMNEQVVFVGGATVSLYINDPAADDVRPTKDVDISLAIASLGELEVIREQLIRTTNRLLHKFSSRSRPVSRKKKAGP